jgi:hypothetical protein
MRRALMVMAFLVLMGSSVYALNPDKIIISKSELTKGGSSLEVTLHFKSELTINTVTLIMPDGTQAPQEQKRDVNDSYEMKLVWNMSGGRFDSGTYKLRFTGISNLIRFTLDKEITI